MVYTVFFKVYFKSDSLKLYRVIFLQDIFEICFHHLPNCTCVYFIKKIRLIVQELRETIQNFINNIIVESVHKRSWDDPTIYKLVFG